VYEINTYCTQKYSSVTNTLAYFYRTFNDEEEEEKSFIPSTLDCQQHFLQVFLAPKCPNRFSCYGVTSLDENCLAYFKRFCIVPASFISVFTQLEHRVKESLLVGV
jgi:hypothetical protein